MRLHSALAWLVVARFVVSPPQDPSGDATRPASRPGSALTAPESAPVKRAPSKETAKPAAPESRAAAAVESPAATNTKIPRSRLAQLCERADTDPTYACDGLENAVVALGKPAIAELGEALRARAATAAGPPLARALGKLAGEKAIPSFSEIARSRDTDARVAAARGLEVVVSRGAVEELLRLLDDETAVVEHAAMDALVAMEKAPQKVGVRGALEKRLALTGQPNSSRARAARCLSRIAHPDSLGALAARLDDRSEDVRAACAEAVGHLKDGAPTVGPKLVDMLDDPDTEVRRQVIFALGRLRFRDAAPRRGAAADRAPRERRPRNAIERALGAAGDLGAPLPQLGRSLERVVEARVGTRRVEPERRRRRSLRRAAPRPGNRFRVIGLRGPGSVDSHGVPSDSRGVVPCGNVDVKR